MTEDPTAQPLRIAVVGVGPRGLSVLERVISHTRDDGPPVELVLVEPGELGSGVHPAKQPDYLLLNTIASQLTIFSDAQMVPGAPVTPGPDFLTWCEGQGVPAAFDDFLPRRLLAEYLQWAAEDLLGRLPQRLTVRHVATAARTVEPSGGASGGAAVTLADGTRLDVDLAVVTTGHGLTAPQAPAPAGDLVDVPYPLPDQVEGVPAGATAALLGTGLTAMDVIAALTVGRGGEFTGEGTGPPGGSRASSWSTARGGCPVPGRRPPGSGGRPRPRT
ncbi:FAD/NAD(P)-binding protein [Streptomyces sp. CC228A]|uniref:FAD/NAD(P)-binding protein n=1 Tax=Streptomyces sp. CC228A TaxID=2898186 RepID=UPI001F2303B6|nr:FAD/NAD(P)-binding protein [Streptomyces sp. CC228A]